MLPHNVFDYHPASKEPETIVENRHCMSRAGNTHSFKGVVLRWVSLAFRLKSVIAVSGKDTSVQAKSIAPVDFPWK